MSVEIGTLEVQVIDAIQLPVVSHMGKQSPFVILRLGTERKQTATSSQGHRSPVWGELLRLPLSTGIEELHVDVYHDSSLRGKTFIATASLNLRTILEAGSINNKLIRIGEAGQIRLNIAFIPNQLQLASSSSGPLHSQPTSHHWLDIPPPTTSGHSQHAGTPPWPPRASNPGAINEAPSWLPGPSGSHLRLAQQLGVQEGSEQGSLEQHGRHTESSSEGARRHSLGNGRDSCSPQRSMRSRLNARFNNLWSGPRGSGYSHDTALSNRQSTESGEGVEYRASPSAEPWTSPPPWLNQGTSEALDWSHRTEGHRLDASERTFDDPPGRSVGWLHNMEGERPSRRATESSISFQSTTQSQQLQWRCQSASGAGRGGGDISVPVLPSHLLPVRPSLPPQHGGESSSHPAEEPRTAPVLGNVHPSGTDQLNGILKRPPHPTPPLPPALQELMQRANQGIVDDTAHRRGLSEGSSNEPEGQPPPPGSFIGMVSPFAQDKAPLKAEDLGPLSDRSGPYAGSSTASHKEEELPPMSDKGKPEGSSTLRQLPSTSGARVPMRNMLEQIEAAAEVPTMRVPSSSSSRLEKSIAEMLSGNENDWLIDGSDLEILMDEHGNMVRLGKGSFGEVFKGVYDMSTEVAIKTIKCETEKDMQEAINEVSLLKNQLHPNIVQFLGLSVSENSIQMVTELMAGNLYTALRKGECLWFEGGAQIAMNVASALAFMHKKKVVHLDMKSPNILLTTNRIAKVADLGLSVLMDKKNFVETMRGLGTLQWTAPEVFTSDYKVTAKADVFSFGTVLWEICTGEVPQRGQLRELRPGEAPSAVAELIHRCLDKDIEKRPTMQEAFSIIKAVQPHSPR